MQPNDPKFIFWLGIFVTIEQGVAGGTLHLTHMIPDSWIPSVTAWCAFLAFVGTALMTGLTGFSSSKTGPLLGASAPRSVPVIVALALVGALIILLLSTGSARAADLPIPPRPMVIGVGGVGVGGAGTPPSRRVPRHHRAQRR